MANPYGPILTGVGLLKDGHISTEARNRYILEVLGLLALGNANGKGGLPTTQIFSSLIPLPPVAGPVIFNVTTLQKENAFWFEPDPIAALLTTQLSDPKNNPFWHAIFVDTLFEKTAILLNANGSTPLAPLFDPTTLFPDIDIKIPFQPPELALKLKITPIELTAKLADLSLALPSIPKLSIPALNLPDLSIPGVPYPGFPKLVLPDLILGLMKIPFDILVKLVLPPAIDIALNPISVVFNLAFDAVLKLLTDLGLLLIVPKLFIASLLIYIKNIVGMICVDIVGLILGAGGVATKTMATLTGLI
jgi:hypothetical protein